MGFELARNISFSLHMILILFITGWVLLYKVKLGAIVFIYKVYVMFFIWYVVCYFSGGCPLTHVENWVSHIIYGKYFYPDYSFKQSMVYNFMKDISNYIPLFTVLMHQILTHTWRRRELSRRKLG